MKELTKEQEQLLNDLYYKDRFLFGRDKLFALDKKHDNHPSQVQVNEWLKKQRVHQLFQKQKRSNVLKLIIAHKPNSFYQADLVDMGQDYIYQGYRYIFTMVDIYSRQAYAVALKNKDEKGVAEGLKKLLEQVKKGKKSIETLQTDNGGEFVNDSFKKILDKADIKHTLTIPGKPMTNRIVERFNGTLKSLIKKDLYARNEDDWVKPLPIYLENYNASIHSSTDFAPEDADLNPESRENLIKRAKKRYANTISPKDIVVGDIVRTKIQKGKLDKHSDINWSKEVKVVEKVYQPKPNSFLGTRYKLKGDKKTYSRNDLILANVSQHPPSEIVRKKKGEYIVEKIVEAKEFPVKDKTTGKMLKRMQYLIQYLGYPSKKDMRWQFYDNIKDTEAYAVWRKTHKS